METKSIILSEKEGKRYELHLLPLMIKTLNAEGHLIYVGSVEDFLQLPNKEEIAEKVVDKVHPGAWEDYEYEDCAHWSPLDSLLGAIGDYKHVIITENEI